VKRRVLELWEEHPERGKQRIAQQMKEENGWQSVVSANTVREILREAGQWREAGAQPKRRKAVVRRAEQPGQTVHADICLVPVDHAEHHQGGKEVRRHNGKMGSGSNKSRRSRHRAARPWAVVSVLLFSSGLLGARAEGAEEVGQKWAVVVGIDTYQHGIEPLSCAVNDAKGVARALVEGAGYRPEQVFVLTSDQQEKAVEVPGTPAGVPTKAGLTECLRRLAGQVGPDDTLLFLFSGHGAVWGEQGYLSLFDTQPDEETWATTSLSHAELRDLLEPLPARGVLILLDACRDDPTRARSARPSETLTETFARGFVLRPRQPQQIRATIFACGLGQRSYEWSEQGHGFFSHFVAAGLRGEAKDEVGQVTIRSLEKYLGQQVPPAAKQKGKTQEPHVRYPPEMPAGSDAVLAQYAPPVKPTVDVANGPRPKSMVLVTEEGPGPADARVAETRLLELLKEKGFELVTPQRAARLRTKEGRKLLHTESPGGALALARQDGAEVLLVGQARAQVLQEEGLGGFVSAGATLDLRAFAAATGELLAARSTELGARPEAPAALGATRNLALRKALQQVTEAALVKGEKPFLEQLLTAWAKTAAGGTGEPEKQKEGP